MARSLGAVLVVLALLTAGCIGADDGAEPLEEQSVTDIPVTEAGQRIISHVAGQALPVPEEARDLVVRVADTGFNGAEPTLGVLSDGTIVTNPFTEGENLLISEDHGQTWEQIGDPVMNPKVNLDPWMWVDEDTDRIYNGPLYVACSWLSWSDDRGESWMANPVAGCGTPAHDHQKITTGPPAPGVETRDYPNVVYYAYNGAFRNVANAPVGPAEYVDGTWVSVSYDGGQTFLNEARVFDQSPCKSGINGPVEVASDGTAYVAHLTCEGVQVGVSEDSGGSWDPVAHITEQGTYAGLIPDPYLATDTADNVYLATPGADGLLYMAASETRARSWSSPVPVT
ncbi:MAG: hypothetical protein R3185_06835, partial [Candidatus Thermoplasmatota archaeon]|nr:hypothetical protein [Candidatus Thermoplasmatota archaeon]